MLHTSSSFGPAHILKSRIQLTKSFFYKVVQSNWTYKI